MEPGGEPNIQQMLQQAQRMQEQLIKSVLSGDGDIPALRAGAYAEAGLKIPWDGLGFVAPCDIANDPHLQPVAQANVTHPPRPQGKARR